MYLYLNFINYFIFSQPLRFVLQARQEPYDSSRDEIGFVVRYSLVYIVGGGGGCGSIHWFNTKLTAAAAATTIW
jgi:hypothetical protein